MGADTWVAWGLVLGGWVLVAALLFFAYEHVTPFSRRTVMAMGFAALLVGGMVAFLILYSFLFDSLPGHIAYFRMTPLERRVAVLNGWGRRTSKARSELVGRLERLGESLDLRQVLYRDPTDGVYWRTHHVETGHSSRDEFSVVAAEEVDELLARFAAAPNA